MDVEVWQPPSPPEFIPPPTRKPRAWVKGLLILAGFLATVAFFGRREFIAYIHRAAASDKAVPVITEGATSINDAARASAESAQEAQQAALAASKHRALPR